MSTFLLDYVKRSFMDRISFAEPALALLAERLDDSQLPATCNRRTKEQVSLPDVVVRYGSLKTAVLCAGVELIATALLTRDHGVRGAIALTLPLVSTRAAATFDAACDLVADRTQTLVDAALKQFDQKLESAVEMSVIMKGGVETLDMGLRKALGASYAKDAKDAARACPLRVGMAMKRVKADALELFIPWKARVKSMRNKSRLFSIFYEGALRSSVLVVFGASIFLAFAHIFSIRDMDEAEKTFRGWPCSAPSLPSCSSSNPVAIARQSYSEETCFSTGYESTSDEEIENTMDHGYILDSSVRELTNSVHDDEEVGTQTPEIQDTDALPYASPSLLTSSSSAVVAGESSTEKIFFTTGIDYETEEEEDAMDYGYILDDSVGEVTKIAVPKKVGLQTPEVDRTDNMEKTPASCLGTIPSPCSSSNSVIVARESDSEQSSFTTSTHSIFDSSSHAQEVEDSSDYGSTLNDPFEFATKAVHDEEVKIQASEAHIGCDLTEVMVEGSIHRNEVRRGSVQANSIVHNNAIVFEAPIDEEERSTRSGSYQPYDDSELETMGSNRIPYLAAFYSGTEVSPAPISTPLRLRTGRIWQKPMPKPSPIPDKYNYFRGGRTTAPPATFDLPWN